MWSWPVDGTAIFVVVVVVVSFGVVSQVLGGKRRRNWTAKLRYSDRASLNRGRVPVPTEANERSPLSR